MRTIFILLFLSFWVFGQTLLNETFSNFTYDETDANLVLLYRFADSANAKTDLSGGGYTLTPVSDIGDSLTANSIITDGGLVIFGNGSSQYYTVDNAGVIKTNDFSIVIKYKQESTGNDEYIFSYRYGRLRLKESDASAGYTYYNGTGFVTGTNASYKIDSLWHVSVFIKDSTGGFGGQFYRDNTLIVDRSQDTTTIVPFDDKLQIYSNLSATPSLWVQGWIAEIIMLDAIPTTKEIAEITYLTRNWTGIGSDATGVTRDNWAFSQGIVNDTIYYMMTLPAGNWNISIKDSAASGVNYEILTSSDAVTWSTLANGTTGTSWGTKNYNGVMGSGYIGIAVASGTAFFDNLKVRLYNSNYLSNHRYLSY